MSRIGKESIKIPSKVEVTIDKQSIEVEGPKGTLKREINHYIDIEKIENEIFVNKVVFNQKSQQLHGLSRTLINNMVIGVSTGFQKNLEIRGVGYRSQLEGSNLILNVGYSNPVKIVPPKELDIKVESNTKIIVSGYDKEKVGEMAAYIRAIRPPEPYKGKGIRYQGEVVKLKVGKAKKGK
uniref:ribosomal protein L6 n=1 Tax=Rhodella violacea TaxID=2801 RepID=UPI001FCDCD8F|nr:ribosomal protein L6 [Rhodella violacea]UNJ18029.1 ribosomal protein L6 [Rhodella violacea]